MGKFVDFFKDWHARTGSFCRHSSVIPKAVSALVWFGSVCSLNGRLARGIVEGTATILPEKR